MMQIARTVLFILALARAASGQTDNPGLHDVDSISVAVVVNGEHIDSAAVAAALGRVLRTARIPLQVDSRLSSRTARLVAVVGSRATVDRATKKPTHTVLFNVIVRAERLAQVNASQAMLVTVWFDQATLGLVADTEVNALIVRAATEEATHFVTDYHASRRFVIRKPPS